MGYSHYIYRPKEINPDTWALIIEDTNRAFNYIESRLGIALADGSGEPGSRPLITKEEIMFNGSEAQPIGVWTTDENISIPWPSPSAGIAEPIADPISEKTDGHWWAGNYVSQRVAPIGQNTGKGSGAYETCGIERIAPGENPCPDSISIA